MKVSIELTLTPLSDDFEPSIKTFIKKIRSLGFKVMENPLSTQIFGTFDLLMPFLNKAIKHSFQGMDLAVLHMKIVKTNSRRYEPHF